MKNKLLRALVRKKVKRYKMIIKMLVQDLLIEIINLKQIQFYLLLNITSMVILKINLTFNRQLMHLKIFKAIKKYKMNNSFSKLKLKYHSSQKIQIIRQYSMSKFKFKIN